jgi:hypothetical protein
LGCIPIDPERNDRISIYDLFSKIEVIPLETTDYSLLSFPTGSPDEVRMNNGKYYFWDRMLQTVKVFDPDGKFIRNIGRRGQGPEEFVTLDDFNINRFTNNIELLSASGYYINIFDPTGDVFLERINLPRNMPITHSFHHLTPDIYVFFHKSGERKMFFYSKENNRVTQNNYSFPEWLRSTALSNSMNPFYVYNDSLFFQEKYNGDVFSISQETFKLIPRYCWDFGRYNFDLNSIPKNQDRMYYLSLRAGNLSMRGAVQFLVRVENSEYYITRFMFKNRNKHLVFNKSTRDYLLFERFTEGGPLPISWIDEESAYAFVAPPFLHLAIDPSMLNDENRRILQSVGEEDNPVVIKYTFK